MNELGAEGDVELEQLPLSPLGPEPRHDHEAIEILGPYVQGIHAKDGLWPTNPKELGKEVPIGQGKVDFPRIIARLKELDYRGAVTIEREISGPQQLEDVRTAKNYLEKLIQSS